MKEVLYVEPKDDHKRLDVFISEKLEDVTRSQVKQSVDKELTTVNGKVEKAGKVLHTGDEVVFTSVEYETSVEPENIPIDIVYEDDQIAVINKPQGMTVHPAVGNYSGTLVNALLYHFKNISDIGGDIRPGIVHRIDKDTSGLLVIAKTNKAHLSLAKQIANKTCKRTYLALVEGVIKEDSGTIDKPIGRDPKDRKKMAVVFDGRPAVTHYKVLKRFNDASFVEFNLETGRTHQIRVHTKSIGHPIIGDKTYGYKNQRFNLNGQLLHAYKLKLVHPTTKKVMEFCAPIPDYFAKILKIFEL